MSGAVSSSHRSAIPDTWPHLDEGEREAGTHCEADGDGVGPCAGASSRLPGALSLLGLCVVPSVRRPASLASSSGHVVSMWLFSLAAHPAVRTRP